MHKKILIISQEFPPFGGGAGVVAQQNAIELAKLDHQVTLVTRNWGPKLEQLNINHLQCTGPKKLWFLFLYWEIKKLYLEDFDSIILNDIGASFIWGTFFLNSQFSKNITVYLHGYEHDAISNKPKGFIKHTKFAVRYKQLLLKSKNIISVSQYLKNSFLEGIPFKIDRERINVIYAGIDPEVFHPVNTDLKQQLSITDDKTILISVSRIVKEKGLFKMLDMFRKLLQIDSSFVWIVIGTGKDISEFKEQVSRNHLKDNVLIIGKIEREHLKDYYSIADLFWLLSEKESFGLTYLEAQMCGCPALGPNKFGIKESIQNNISGYLVDDDTNTKKILSAKTYLKLNINIDSLKHKYEIKNQIKILKEII